MTERIIIAGSGGQGIMLLGKVLAEAAMREGRYVTCLPSYGAEVRGGTAHCTVIISETEIGSPYVKQADTLMIMNTPSLERFKNRITPKGLLILNNSLVPRYTDRKIHVLQYPFTDIAIKLGNIRVANMVALGCFIAKKNIVHSRSVFKVISDIAPQEKRGLIKINRQALSTGMGLIK